MLQYYEVFEKIVKHLKDTYPTFNTTMSDEHMDGYGRSFKCVNSLTEVSVHWGKNFIDREVSEVTTILKYKGADIAELTLSLNVTNFKMCNEECKEVFKLLQLE